MQFSLKGKIQIITNYLTIIIITMTCFSSCYEDNSDQIVQKTTTTKHFEPEELLEELSLDSIGLKENVVVVSGIIEDINFLNDRSTIILKGREDTNVFVICDMQENQAILIKNLERGESITIRGILKGSLKDIILLNCIINN